MPVLRYALLLLALTALAAADNPWRASEMVLVERIEALVAGRQVDAAAAVFAQLESRKDANAEGQVDRARLALARGWLAAARIDQALTTVQAIPWADKAPQVAAEIVGLELGIRWRGLFADGGPALNGARATGVLISGILPPSDVADASPDGSGPWAQRQAHWQAWAALRRDGTAMIAAEGGTLADAAGPAWQALAAFAYGDMAAAERFGPVAGWDVDFARHVALLALSEHRLPDALAAANIVWQRFPDLPAAAELAEAFCTWDERRQVLAHAVRLWPLPELTAQVAALRTRHPAAAASARRVVADDAELQALARGATWMPPEAPRTVVPEQRLELIDEDDGLHFAWQRHYSGFLLSPTQQITAQGDTVALRLDHRHAGGTTVAVHRLADFAAWQALATDPAVIAGSIPLRQEQFPAALPGVGEQALWQGRTRELTLAGLEQGYYAVTAGGRGVPIVALAGFAVLDTDLHLLAGGDAALAWAVRRSTGRAQATVPLRLELELVRTAETAVADWDARAPAWRAGFRSAFFNEPIEALIAAGQEDSVKHGTNAGRAARERDPPRHWTLRGTSDAAGLWRPDLPPELQGRAYRATLQLDRPEVQVVRRADYVPPGAWLKRSLAWADRPLLRPGETLHWKLLLRGFDGELFRLERDAINVALLLDETVVWRQILPLGDDGTAHGAWSAPKGCAAGRLRLRIGEVGSETTAVDHVLGKVDALPLPALTIDLDEPAAEMRAGEDVVLDLVLRDRHGAPLPGMHVVPNLLVLGPRKALPAPTVDVPLTDAGGRTRVRIATLAGIEARYRLDLAVDLGDRTWSRHCDWRTASFPWPLQVRLDREAVELGGSVLLQAQFPTGAPLDVQFVQGGQALGQAWRLTGRGAAWSELRIPVGEPAATADGLRLSAPVLDGPAAERVLPLAILPQPRTDTAAQLDLVLTTTRCDPGETVTAQVQVARPDREVLVVAGTRRVLAAEVTLVDRVHSDLPLNVAEDWAPQVQVAAVAYLPEHGFVRSSPRSLDVRPVQRLLRLDMLCDHEEYEPGGQVGALVTVRDWRGQPVKDARLSLGIVDERLYALAEDETPDLWNYFHMHQRPWALREGVDDSWHFPPQQLLISVVRQWSSGRGARGCSQTALGRHSGGRSERCRACKEPRPLLPEHDAAIHWIADLRTDAAGQARVGFSLPAEPGRFRVTARGNDASAAVLVGELRQRITSRRQVDLRLDLPTHAAPGDQVPATVHLANREDQPLSLRVRLSGIPDPAPETTMVLPALGARTWTTLVTVPQPDCPTAGAGGLIGRPWTIGVAVSGDGLRHEQKTEVRLLVREAGIPEDRAWVLRADSHGAVALPALPARTGWLHLRLRPTVDVAARRESLLTQWCEAGGAEAALAWLLAKPGRAAGGAMAKSWMELGNAALDDLVRVEAMRIGRMPQEDLLSAELADWQQARAQALGLRLPPRHCEPADDALIAAATALLRGDAEAIAAWPDTMHRLHEELAENPIPSVAQRRALAIALDASRISRQGDAGMLRLRLAGLRWDDDALVAALACLDAVASAPEAPAARCAVQHPQGSPSVLDPDGAWCGDLTQVQELHAAPQSLLALDAVVQLAYPELSTEDGSATWMQRWDASWHPANDGRLAPGRATALRLDVMSDGDTAWRLLGPDRLVPDNHPVDLQFPVHAPSDWVWIPADSGMETDTELRTALATLRAQSVPRQTMVNAVVGESAGVLLYAQTQHGGCAVRLPSAGNSHVELQVLTTEGWRRVPLPALHLDAKAPAPQALPPSFPHQAELERFLAKAEPVRMKTLSDSLCGCSPDDWRRALDLAQRPGAPPLWQAMQHEDGAERAAWLSAWLDTAPLRASRISDWPLETTTFAPTQLPTASRAIALGIPALGEEIARIASSLAEEHSFELFGSWDVPDRGSDGLLLLSHMHELRRLLADLAAQEAGADATRVPGTWGLADSIAVLRRSGWKDVDDSAGWSRRQRLDADILYRLTGGTSLADWQRLLKDGLGQSVALDPRLDAQLGAITQEVAGTGGFRLRLRQLPGGRELIAGMDWGHAGLAGHGLRLVRQGRGWLLTPVTADWRPQPPVQMLAISGSETSAAAVIDALVRLALLPEGSRAADPAQTITVADGNKPAAEFAAEMASELLPQAVQAP